MIIILLLKFLENLSLKLIMRDKNEEEEEGSLSDVFVGTNALQGETLSDPPPLSLTSIHSISRGSGLERGGLDGGCRIFKKSKESLRNFGW